MIKIFITVIFLFIFSQSFAQHLGFSFQEEEKKNISIQHLDSIYQSAVHVDTSKAVFKTDSLQESMYNAYVKMLRDFGKYLVENNFEWEKVTKGFNRIYFNKDGTIDYFVYNFRLPNVKPEDVITEEREKEFSRLLNLFISTYKIDMSADRKFVQCSPVTFSAA